MKDSIYRITLDMHDVASQVQITAKKGDTARKIYINLTEYGEPYIVGTGCYAVIMMKKPSGAVIMNDCDIHYGDGIIMYEFTEQTVAEIGMVECEVRVYGTGYDLITSPRFTIRVSETVFDDGQTESAEEFNALTSAITHVNNLDVDVYKYGNTATITVTKKDGTTKSVTVSDGDVDVSELLAQVAMKANKAPSSKSGNLAALDENGNLVDSHISPDDIVTEFDVSGFCKKSDLAKKVDKVATALESDIPVFDTEGGIKDSGIKLSDITGGGGSATGSSEINLLDNGHFMVNQRGLTEYVGTGYTVDRWKFEGDGKVNVNSDGSIKITNNDTQYSVNFLQRFNHNSMKTGTYVLSVKCNGKIFSIKLDYTNGRFDYKPLEFTDGTNKATIRINYGEYHHNINISPVGKTINKIQAVKLEVGLTSTLANDIPIYCEEALRCLSATEVNGDKYSNQGLSSRGMGLNTPSFKSIYAGIADMVDGVTALDTGIIYLQYEE